MLTIMRTEWPISLFNRLAVNCFSSPFPCSWFLGLMFLTSGGVFFIKEKARKTINYCVKFSPLIYSSWSRMCITFGREIKFFSSLSIKRWCAYLFLVEKDLEDTQWGKVAFLGIIQA